MIWSSPSLFRSFAAMWSASPTANRPTATMTMSTPLPSWSTPAVRRGWPVSWSMPTQPIRMPRKSEIRPRVIERATSVVTDANAISASMK
ncbi:unannotated protein [freshwater metagenome]|uniref:Unannotated protein n=1 Tax=freshwater metagenome TaxID=449393 RepID=A0A6J7G245_9ZZZZ